MRSDVVPPPHDAGTGGGLARRRGGLAALIVAAACTAGCASTVHPQTIEPPPPKDTHAVLAGPLCGDNRCSCRSEAGDGGAGVPDTAGKKRFEVRLGPSPYELWLTINKSTVLYKSPERAEVCFYVDLST